MIPLDKDEAQKLNSQANELLLIVEDIEWITQIDDAYYRSKSAVIAFEKKLLSDNEAAYN